jgi:hypothetical protein
VKGASTPCPVFAALAFAESWAGTLIDASCYSQQKTASSCPATASTTAFALQASDKVYMFDDSGNAKAAAAMKNRADRSTDSTHKSSPISATVSGTLEDSTIKVDSVNVQ